jgi:hypothetical protein
MFSVQMLFPYRKHGWRAQRAMAATSASIKPGRRIERQ